MPGFFPLSKAKRAKHLAFGWRFAPVSLAIALVLGLAPVLIPVAALVLTLTVWHLIGVQVSKYNATKRSFASRFSRSALFHSGLFATLAFLVVAVSSTTELIAKPREHIGWFVGSCLLLGGWLLWRVILEGWRFHYALLGLSLVTGVMLAEMMLHQKITAPRDLPWPEITIRLALTYLVGATIAAATRFRRRSDGHVSPISIMESGAYVAVLGVMMNGTPWARVASPNESIIWVVSAFILFVLTSMIFWQAALPIRRDRNWLRDVSRRGLMHGPAAPLGLWTMLALFPAIALAPTASWFEWILVWVLGAVSLGFRTGVRPEPLPTVVPSPTVVRNSAVAVA